MDIGDIGMTTRSNVLSKSFSRRPQIYHVFETIDLSHEAYNTLCILSCKDIVMNNNTHCIDTSGIFGRMNDSIKDAAQRLRWAREQAGYASAKAFAERHNIGVGTYTHHENGTRNFSTESASRYAQLLKISADWLVTGKGQPERVASNTDAHKVFIKSAVEAGVWANHPHETSDEFPDPVFLPTFMTAPYTPHEGIVVRGDSMDLIYPENSVLFVMRIAEYVASGGEISNGLDVIIHRTNSEGAVESTVKRIQISNGKYWAVPCSNNPAHQSVEIDCPTSWSDVDQDYSGKVFVAGVVLCSMQKTAHA